MKSIKTALILLFLGNSSSAWAKEKICLDIRQRVPQIVILQKLDDHNYELGSELIPGARWLLKTKKAIFNRAGYPVGIAVFDNFETIEVQMTSGFKKSVSVFRECGLTEIPKNPIINSSERKMTKEEKQKRDNWMANQLETIRRMDRENEEWKRNQ